MTGDPASRARTLLRKHTAAGGRMDNARMPQQFMTPQMAWTARVWRLMTVTVLGFASGPLFFLASTLAAVPGLCLLWWLRKDVQALEGPVAAKSEA
ncbi:MAG: hypothetical protein ACKOE3_09570 [Betaproteobacteria bacterium]